MRYIYSYEDKPAGAKINISFIVNIDRTKGELRHFVEIFKLRQRKYIVRLKS